ncbi:MAG: T9SS type A sorting domain-containing protein, partial [Flavobacteriales bacterium]|nr:T9SS type A sorting domain-containing protein [Flavobacteriales bacterium]
WYSTSHWPNVAVATWGTQGISFSGCTFKNNSPLYFSGFNSRYKGKGIYAEDAALAISDCTFENLWTGIETGLISTLAGMKIKENDFVACNYGVFNRNQNHVSVVQNTFDSCGTSTLVEATLGFENTQNTYENGFEGILVRNAGALANEIYDNNFEGMSRGIRAYGNTQSSNKGLLFKCNLFESLNMSLLDIYVGSGEVSRVQGICLDQDPINKNRTPAGNEFSHTCNNSWDLGAYIGLKQRYPGSNKLWYSHHFDNGSGPYKPRCYTQQEITTINCLATGGGQRGERCPQRYFIQGGLSDFQNKVSALRAQYYDMKDAQNDAENRYYNYLLDGGNTASLLNYIDPQSGYGSASVYQEVMSATPFASDTVLHTCILRNPALDTAHLYGILISNSPLSPYIHDAAVSYSNLSAEQLTQLAGAQVGTSPRMDSIALMRHYRNEAELTFNEIFRNFILDTNCVAKADSIIAWLAPLNGRRHLGEALVRAYWEKENYAAANDVITEIGQDTNFNHLSVILNKLNNVFQSNDSLPRILTDSVLLDSIANDTTRIGYALARNILTLLNGREYPMPYWEFEAPSGMIVEPEIDPTGEKETAVKKFANISVSPNPNDGKISISIGGSKSARAYRMALYDLQGRVIYERILDGQLAQQTLHLPGYVLGNVILKIYDTNNNEVYQNRLVIIR